MKRCFPLLLCLALTACAPPGIDPEAAEKIKQRWLAKDDAGKPAPAEEADEPALPPAPPPAPVMPISPSAETVTITSISVTGYWRLNTYLQMSFGLGVFHKAKTDLGARDDRDICELVQVKKKVRSLCLRKSYASSSGSLDDDELTLDWSTGPGTMMFEGKVKGERQIDGGLGIGVMGVRVSEQVPASLSKFTPSPAEPGPLAAEAAMRAVLADLDKGMLTEGRYTAAAVGFLHKAMVPKGTLAGLGLPDSLLYLGSIRHKRPEEKAEKSVVVYEIHSGPHKVLCGVSQNEEGLVTDFMCSGQA